jgi:hypothetical protein
MIKDFCSDHIAKWLWSRDADVDGWTISTVWGLYGEFSYQLMRATKGEKIVYFYCLRTVKEIKASVIYRPEDVPWAVENGDIADHKSGWKGTTYTHEYLIRGKWLPHEEAMSALGLPVK